MRAALVFAVILSLIAAVVSPPVFAANAGTGHALPIPQDKAIPVTPVKSAYHGAPAMPAWSAKPVAWPAGNADLAVTATASTSKAALPLAVRPAGPTAPSGVHVTVAPQATSAAAGVNGVVMSLHRNDSATASGPVHVTVDYRSFAGAFGGDWASRLNLVELPACALTTPTVAACRTRTPLPSTNDTQAGTVSADVTLAGSAPAQRAAAPDMVVAATSSTGGGGGDYSATSLKPAGAWTAGGSADGFNWSYPITVPPVPGGLTPKVALTYNSQSVDGLSSGTNNQASWIGDGWSYEPGFIERSYQSCHDNPDGATKTWDNCWSGNNTLNLSLAGQTNVLVPDNTTPGLYHTQGDDNEHVQYFGQPNQPGQPGNEYFVVTTNDGTQYFFGKNQLPGWQNGNPVTNSVWSEPIYSTAAGQPCYSATFSASVCAQPYRWNLDYVKDTHGDVVSYFYQAETNLYASDLGSTSPASSSYTRGGFLTKIQYGQRDQQEFSTSPGAQVVFTSTGRCDQTSCDPKNLSTSTAGHWPDVPFDLNCTTSGGSCNAQSPSFWSEYTLQTIQATALQGTTETPVDSWSLTHRFPTVTDPNTQPSLWLDSITHTGQDPSGGGSTAAIALPKVSFTEVPLNNRVNLTNGLPWITRERMNKITTEAGEVITVGYSSPSCSPVPADPSQNQSLCYPVYWTPTGQIDPVQDWFNKYIVATVTEHDPTGGSANDDVVTTYTPSGTPAWHYNDNPVVPANRRTWDQWRGYAGMTVSTGHAPDPITSTAYTYFRGMNGDTLPNNGTRGATVTDLHGDPATTDANQFTGYVYDKVVSNGGAVVSDTVTDPWTSAPTASANIAGFPALQSFHIGTADTKVYTPLADGTTRQTEIDYTHDAYGRVTVTNDLGDVATPSDDLCTTQSYADNTGADILGLPAETKTVSVACSTTPTQQNTVSDEQDFYDKSTTLGASPTVGDVTMKQNLISYNPDGTPNESTTTNVVDQYGRVTRTTDPNDHTTNTAYTPATGAGPTSETVTDPLGNTTTTTYDPLRNQPLATTDAAGYTTTKQYDTLGELTAVLLPGIDVPMYKFSYTVSNTGPSVVDKSTLDDDGTYHTTETLYDSMLRVRETQTQTQGMQVGSGIVTGRLISDTMYNTDGWQSETTDPYFADGTVSPTMVQAQAGQVPSLTGYTYDGAGRKTAAIAYQGTSSGPAETWRTSYAYGGDSTTTIPPAGGAATTTIVDGRNRTADLFTYHSGVAADPVHDPASAYDDTHYTYAPNNKPATVVDAAGNTWRYGYDLLGNQTSAQDPDTGTTITTYDPASNPVTVTDGRGKQTTTVYDSANRKTATYDTTGGAPQAPADQIAAWTYDTVAAGYLTSSTSYSGGDTYTHSVLSYNAMAKPDAVQDTLTGQDGSLLPKTGLTTSYGYNLTGSVHDQQDPASANLAPEDLNFGYDQFGQPTSVSSKAWTYVDAVGYTTLGQPAQYMLGGSPTVTVQESYDPQTQALTQVQTTDSLSSNVVDNITYGLSNPNVSKGAGLLVSTTDQQNGNATTDTQCFGYDYAKRLSAAWTATDQCAATPQSGNSASVGGPNPYWQTWTYDAAGNRATQTDHDTGGTAANDTTTTYGYVPGQPHTLGSTTATGPSAPANTASYTYDASGNTTGVNGSAIGSQTMTWTDQGRLATDTTGAGTSSYVYDADGNLLVHRDPGQTTLNIGDEELVLNTKTNTASATRYYSIGGVVIAARTGGANPQYLVPDRQGTDQLAIDAVSETVTRRQYLPFGQARGPVPTTWAGGDKGYVGGTADTATGLENLGAREYDAVAGRFLSRDSKFESDDPNQMGGYDYAANNPVTGSDPTGLNWFTDAVGAVGNALHTAGNWIEEHPTMVLGVAALACTFIPGAQPIAFLLTAASVASGAVDTVKDIKKGDYTAAAWDGLDAVASAVDAGFLVKSAHDMAEAADIAQLYSHISPKAGADGEFMDQIIGDNATEEMEHSAHHLLEARALGADSLIDSANGDAAKVRFEHDEMVREVAERQAKDREAAEAYETFIGPAAPDSPVGKQRHPDVPAPPEPQRGRYVAF